MCNDNNKIPVVKNLIEVLNNVDADTVIVDIDGMAKVKIGRRNAVKYFDKYYEKIVKKTDFESLHIYLIGILEMVNNIKSIDDDRNINECKDIISAYVYYAFERLGEVKNG